jgi:hypothetical protein
VARFAEPRERSFDACGVGRYIETRRSISVDVMAALRRACREHTARIAERAEQFDERSRRESRKLQAHPGLDASVDDHLTGNAAP